MLLSIFFPEIYAKQTVGTFYYNQKNSHNTSKIGYKITKKTSKITIMPIPAMTLQWLCSGFRVHHKYRNKLRKLLKQKQSHSTYQIAADGMTGRWLHDQFANRVKKEPVAMLLRGLCSGSISKYWNSKNKLEKIAGKW